MIIHVVLYPGVGCLIAFFPLNFKHDYLMGMQVLVFHQQLKWQYKETLSNQISLLLSKVPQN